MEKIIFDAYPELRLETYTREAKSQPSGEAIEGVFVSAHKHEPHVLFTSDEVPFFFYAPKQHLFGAMKLTKENSLQEYLLKEFHTLMVQYNLSPEDVVCYLGPSLTFSHVTVERPMLLKIMDMGYRAAAKRTSGVDFFDVPVMNVLMLRKLGVPAENITIDSHDTYECDSLLYSSLRGDSKKNPTVIELLA